MHQEARGRFGQGPPAELEGLGTLRDHISWIFQQRRRFSDICFYNINLHVSFSILEAIDDVFIIELDKTIYDRQLF